MLNRIPYKANYRFLLVLYHYKTTYHKFSGLKQYLLFFRFCRSEVEYGLPRFFASGSQQRQIQVSEGSVASSETSVGKNSLPNSIRLLEEVIYL